MPRSFCTSGERLDGAVAHRLHDGDHCRRIDPARQKGAQRQVRRHLAVKRLAQQGVNVIDRLVGRAGKRFGPPAFGSVTGGPVDFRPNVAAPVLERQYRAGLDLGNTFKDEVGGGNIVMAHQKR